MIDVAGLALPFFGLIFLGGLAGRIWRRPEAELAWLNVFVIYFALPAMFYRLISETPIEELANGRFVFATTLSTYTVFALCFAFASIWTRGDVRVSTLEGLVGSYGNVGYMGPPLALLALGEQAAVPAALVFCFDVVLIFTLAPLMMALAGASDKPRSRLLLYIPKNVILHPFIIATLLGVAGAALELRPPEPIDRLITALAGSAAPCALFALGVTVASRPLKRVPGELPFLIFMKLAGHPTIAFLFLTWMGGFERVWVETAVLMASLPPAATLYVIATQYGTYVQRASSAVLIGTAISVFTVTGMLYIVTHDMLPWGLFGP